MRILITILTILCFSFVNPAIFAKAETHHKPMMAKKAPVIILYEAPATSSKVIGKVDLWQTLIPIYKNKGWVKVGDPKDGKVGWVNIKDYHKTVADYTKLKTSSIYVQTKQLADKGKKQVIEVYENGKKVTGKKAQEIYKKMQQQEAKTEAQINKMQQQMNKMMQDFSSMPSMFTFPTPPVVVVVQQP